MPSPSTPDDPAAPSSTAPLRALAHPMRSRLLQRLRALDRATATDLARDLGTNTGATSYHLRRLAEAGLVEDTGEGTGRRRIWRPASEDRRWTAGDVADDTDAETALTWLDRDYLQLLADRSSRWLDVEREWPLPWREALGVRDDHVVATAEQVVAMQEEISAVIERYRRVGQGNPTARRVSVWTVSYPIDLDSPPRRDVEISRSR